MEAVAALLYVVFLVIAIVAVFAQLRLFSIDRSLKEIVAHMKAVFPLPEVASATGSIPKTISKEVWACKNCNDTTAIERGKPSRCGFCGRTDFEQKTIQVIAPSV